MPAHGRDGESRGADKPQDTRKGDIELKELKEIPPVSDEKEPLDKHDWRQYLQRVRIFGGIQNNLPSNVHWKPSFEKGVFVKDDDLKPLGEELKAHHSLCLTETGFLVTGGIATKMCYHFDVASEQWVKLADLRLHRHSHISFAINKRYFVAGGKVRRGDDSDQADTTGAADSGDSRYESVDDFTIDMLITNEATPTWRQIPGFTLDATCIKPLVCVVVRVQAAYILNHQNYNPLIEFRCHAMNTIEDTPDYEPAGLYNNTVMGSIDRLLYIANPEATYVYSTVWTEGPRWTKLKQPLPPAIATRLKVLGAAQFFPAVLSFKELETIVIFGGRGSRTDVGSDEVKEWRPNNRELELRSIGLRTPEWMFDHIAYILPEPVVVVVPKKRRSSDSSGSSSTSDDAE